MQIDELPPLPVGWHYEQSAFNDDVVHIVWPQHGAISLHFGRRAIELGACVPRTFTNKAWRGPGWRKAMVTNAVEQLQGVWNG